MYSKTRLETSPTRLALLTVALGVLPGCFLLTEEEDSSVDVNISPEAEIVGPRSRSVFGSGQPITFTGSADDSEDGTLTGTNLIWTSDLSGSLGAGSPLVVPGLSPGVHTVRLTATDSDGASADAEITVIVLPESYGGANQAPELTIVQPAPRSPIPVGQTIQFEGMAVDPEEGPLPDDALQWSVFGTVTDAARAMRGPIGTGPSISRGDLPAGAYQVTFEGLDAYLADGTAETHISVYDPTVPCTGTGLALSQNPIRLAPGGVTSLDLTITRPGFGFILTRIEDGAADRAADVIASSSFDHELNGARERIWTVQVREDVPPDASFDLELAAYVTGASPPFRCSLPVRVEIAVAQQGNGAPAVTITAPVSGDVFVEGLPVDFTASADDSEDGPLSGTSVTWTSSIDGVLGIDVTMTRALSAGQHVITATATDGGGLSSSASVTVDVTPNAPPVPVITAPADGARFTLGDEIAFRGEANDPEDGAITGVALDWESNVSGALGSGSSLDRSDLVAGTHVVTLIARDSHGITATTSVTIDVQPNAPPTPVIASPADGQVFTLGEVIDFDGAASDVEDGALTGSQLVWSSDRDGQLGVGVGVSRDDLRVGPHTITLTAIDSHGAAGTTTVDLRVDAPLANGAINGTVAAGGYGFPGITVTLAGPVGMTTQTLAFGVYSFTGLPPGTYTVSISNTPVYLTFPVTSQDVVLGPGQVLDVSFTGTISEQQE